MTDVAPEHESVEAFVEFCMDDEVDTFTHEDLGHIAFSTRQSRCVVRGELESYGLTRSVVLPGRRGDVVVVRCRHQRTEGVEFLP